MSPRIRSPLPSRPGLSPRLMERTKETTEEMAKGKKTEEIRPLSFSLLLSCRGYKGGRGKGAVTTPHPLLGLFPMLPLPEFTLRRLAPGVFLSRGRGPPPHSLWWWRGSPEPRTASRSRILNRSLPLPISLSTGVSPVRAAL